MFRLLLHVVRDSVTFPPFSWRPNTGLVVTFAFDSSRKCDLFFNIIFHDYHLSLVEAGQERGFVIED